MTLSNLIASTKNLIKTKNVNQHTLLNVEKIYNNYNNSDWKNMIVYNKNKYTRNLVYKNDFFQIILMCWPPGYKSPIHDHNKSECFYKILKGKLIEKIYQIENDKMKLINEVTLHSNQLGKINDQLGYHLVHNNTNDYTISLHLYTPTYYKTNIFEVNDNMTFKKKEVNLFFDNQDN